MSPKLPFQQVTCSQGRSAADEILGARRSISTEKNEADLARTPGLLGEAQQHLSNGSFMLTHNQRQLQ